MRFLIVVLSNSPSTTTSNDGIRSKPSTSAYTKGWDNIFGKSSGSSASN